MIRFRTLGGVDLRDSVANGGIEAALAQPKRLALLAYLALARPRGFHSREFLVALFWPEASPSRARHALNQAAYFLRRTLGEDVLLTRGDAELGLDWSRFSCDALEFERAFEAGDWSAALSTYGGELLPGLYLDGCVEFERWLESTRQRLRDQAVAAAGRLADERGTAGDLVGASVWLRRAREWAPYDEALVRRLLSVLAQLGDRAGALREYEAFAGRLAQDLELEPGVETVAIVNAIRTAHPDSDVRPAAGSPGADSSAAPPLVELPALRLPRTAPRRRAWLGVGSLVAGSAVVTALATRGLWSGSEITPHRVLVLELRDETGDPRFAGAGRWAADWIAQGLGATGLVEVVPLIPTPRPASNSADDIRAHAREAAAATVVDGAYYLRADSLLFQIRLLDGAKGRVRLALPAIAGPAADPLEAVEGLRRRVIGALATLVDPRFNQWAAVASTPPSYEAYREYAEALDAYLAVGSVPPEKAAGLFLEAAALDSTFTAPLLWAIRAYWDASRVRQADSLTSALAARRDRLPPWDRAMLDFWLGNLRGDLEAAHRAMDRVVTITPGSEWVFYQATSALWINRPQETLDLLLGLNPDRGWLRRWPYYWTIRMQARHRLGDYAGELADAAVYLRRFDRGSWFSELRPLAAMGRVNEVMRRVEPLLTAAEQDRSLRLQLHRLALELKAHGYRASADSLYDRLLAAYGRVTPAERQTALLQRDLGPVLFAAGRWDSAERVFDVLRSEGSKFASDWAVHALWGILAVRRGDWAEAERVMHLLANWKANTFGEHLTWRAGLAAHLGDKAEAVRLLHEAAAQGLFQSDALHVRPELEPLWSYQPFQDFLRPRR